MTADSSTTTVMHSGEGGVNSPSRRKSFPSPWAQVVRGRGESESVVLRSPRVSENHSVLCDQLSVFEPEPEPVVVVSNTQPEGFDVGNVGGGKKLAWNKPSANGVIEGRNTPVMGAVSWPALSESTRPVPKSLPLPDQSSKHSSDGLVTVFQLKSTGRQQSLLKGNSWVPRPMGVVGSHQNVVHDHSSNKTPSRRNNFSPRPRGEGGLRGNGYGFRREHYHRDWRGHRSSAFREVPVPQEVVSPPPLPPMGYFRPGSPFAAQTVKPYATPMGYEMDASLVYYSMLPTEPYMSTSLLPQAVPPPMATPVLDPPLHVQIRDQIEYYFSDANLVTDNFLRSHMDIEGWVPISLIAGFRRVQILTSDVQMILNSLKYSISVEIKGDKLRRRNDWRNWVLPLSFDNWTAQSPRGATNNSMEETFIEKLTLAEVTTKEHAVVDDVESCANKGVCGLIDSSKLTNVVVTAVEPCLSHI